jgi:hypothetical protein
MSFERRLFFVQKDDDAIGKTETADVRRRERLGGLLKYYEREAT